MTKKELLNPGIHHYLSSLLASKRPFREVETYCMFIGYPRSGHTLIGALMDAHPDMVVAHELHALQFLQKGYSRKQIFHLLLKQSQAFFAAGSNWVGYSYRVPGQWQGRYRNLKVIGDKKGGGSSRILRTNPELLKKIHGFCPRFKILHVIRNPFDSISTVIRRKQRRRQISRPFFQQMIDQYFQRVATIDSLKRQHQYDILDIHLEDFIKNPSTELAGICQFVGVEAEQDYLNACEKIVFKKYNQSRKQIDQWTPETIQTVQEKMAQYGFLERYSFD